MTSPDVFRAPELLTVKQAVERLHGSDYTQTDINRMWTAIRRGTIEYSEIGGRKFIPVWQVEKLVKRAL